MASQFEATFLSSVVAKIRKRSDLLDAIEKIKTVSLSDISDMISVLSKEDNLYLIQAKVPDAIYLAKIIRAIPEGIPQSTKKTLLLLQQTLPCR